MQHVVGGQTGVYELIYLTSEATLPPGCWGGYEVEPLSVYELKGYLMGNAGAWRHAGPVWWERYLAIGLMTGVKLPEPHPSQLSLPELEDGDTVLVARPKRDECKYEEYSRDPDDWYMARIKYVKWPAVDRRRRLSCEWCAPA